MTEEMMDYAADLAIVESIKADNRHYWQTEMDFAELACNSLEWYIRKVMGLEMHLSWALQQLTEGYTLNDHICAYFKAPDKGYCEFCDKYAKAMETQTVAFAVKALSTSSPAPATDRVKEAYGTPETWRKDGSDKAKWAKYYEESGRICADCANLDTEEPCSCWGDKFVLRDGLAALEKADIIQLCVDQRGSICTVRESLCDATGENTCCLTCGKAKNCEDPCEYVPEKAGGEKLICSTCHDIGEITVFHGQTPEIYDEENIPCPKCLPEKEGGA